LNEAPGNRNRTAQRAFHRHLDSLLVLNDPRAPTRYVVESRFLYRCIFPNGNLPQKPVWELLGTNEVLVILYADAAKEWFRPVASYAVDLISMCMICQILKPKVVFEIGTFHGVGELHWAGNAQDAEVYTLDLPTQRHSLTSSDRHRP
jgi:hypothetical protein